MNEARERIPGWGVDTVSRPGVPLRPEVPTPAAGAHVDAARQALPRALTRRRDLRRAPRIVGTQQPPRGLSGAVRRLAYRIPEHEGRHWLVLMAADRIDVLEGRLARTSGLVLLGGLLTTLLVGRVALRRLG